MAYLDRTSLPCSPLSFRDIAGGALPPLPAESHHLDMNQWSNTPVIDMVICSFALHLINNPSELFALLWELSTKSRWLVILAPHKKPEVQLQHILFCTRTVHEEYWMTDQRWLGMDEMELRRMGRMSNERSLWTVPQG